MALGTSVVVEGGLSDHNAKAIQDILQTIKPLQKSQLADITHPHFTLSHTLSRI